MFFYKIDVIGENGYSFMVSSNDLLDDNEVIDKAKESGLFTEDIDANYAFIDDLVDETDVEHFESCGCLHNIS